MAIYCIDAERLLPVKDHQQACSKERCFVEASSMEAAVALRPESPEYEITSIVRIGNIIAREPAKLVKLDKAIQDFIVVPCICQPCPDDGTNEMFWREDQQVLCEGQAEHDHPGRKVVIYHRGTDK